MTQPSPVELIKKITDAVRLADILSPDRLKEEYKSIIRLIHPDKCNLPEAGAATKKLNEFKTRYEDGVEAMDDAGKLRTNDYVVTFEGNKAALQQSFDNFTRLKRLNDDLLDRFLPLNMKMQGDKLVTDIGIRAIPLTKLILPQEHVNWVFSRILEFTSFLQEHGYSHMGITPESVYVMPNEHWIKVVSFYHMGRLGARGTTISAAHRNWYPSELLSTKTITPKVDVEMAKKIAISLLGDPSGVGIRLKKTHHKAFLDFVLSNHNGSIECHVKYREMLAKNFEKKFYDLKL